jgi:hypothetical protein
MTTKPFSSTLNDYILSVIQVRALSMSTDWELASRIWHAIEHISIYAAEGHDFEAILAQVKNLRAAHMGPGASAAGNASAYRRNNSYSSTEPSGNTSSSYSRPPPPPPPPPGGSGTGSGSSSWSWRSAWTNFTSTAGANARSWRSAARSAWSGFRGAMAGSGGAGAGGSGRGGGRGWGGWWGGPGGGRGGRGGRGGGRNWWSSWFGAGGGMGGRGGGGAGPGGGMSGDDDDDFLNSVYPRHDPGENKYWKWQQFIPRQQGFFGRVGEMAGLKMGGAGRQAVGGFLGQFVDALKNCITQARVFATELKAANRYLINYHGGIAASYAESDVMTTFRNFRMAQATAPSTIGLNRALTRANESAFQRDVFNRNIINEYGGFRLGMFRRLDEQFKPMFQLFNSLSAKISPQGDLGERTGHFVVNAALTTAIQALVTTIPILGPFTTAIKEFINWMNGDKDKKAGNPVLPWENMFEKLRPPGAGPDPAFFNKNPIRGRGKGRF